jgi:hypothetical protein
MNCARSWCDGQSLFSGGAARGREPNQLRHIWPGELEAKIIFELTGWQVFQSGSNKPLASALSEGRRGCWERMPGVFAELFFNVRRLVFPGLFFGQTDKLAGQLLEAIYPVSAS